MYRSLGLCLAMGTRTFIPILCQGIHTCILSFDFLLVAHIIRYWSAHHTWQTSSVMTWAFYWQGSSPSQLAVDVFPFLSTPLLGNVSWNWGTWQMWMATFERAHMLNLSKPFCKLKSIWFNQSVLHIETEYYICTVCMQAGKVVYPGRDSNPRTHDPLLPSLVLYQMSYSLNLLTPTWPSKLASINDQHPTFLRSIPRLTPISAIYACKW